MEFSFEGLVKLTMDYQEGETRSKHVSTEFLLNVSDGLDKSKYLDHEELPNAEGSFALSNVLVQGLIGNIHFAHDVGFRDSAEHLRWIIAELEKSFVAVANVTKSTYNDK